MDSNKHSIPYLPPPQSILEDLKESAILKLDENLHLKLDDDPLQEAFICFSRLKQLCADLHKHQKLNSELEIVDEELVDSIKKMKKQQVKNSNLSM